MKKYLLIFILLISMIVPFGNIHAQGPDTQLGAEQRADIVNELADIIESDYVLDDIALQMADYLRSQLADGAYDSTDTISELALLLNVDLKTIYEDKHLSVQPILANPGGDGVIIFGGGEETPPNDHATDDDHHGFDAELIRDAMQYSNFGVSSASRLSGNIGYLDLRIFAPLAIGDQKVAYDAIVSAMNMLVNSDAIIIDLRNNTGGEPDMVQFLASYFFDDDPVHLNSLYSRRNDETEEYWTQPEEVPYQLPDVPVYILTGSLTFSAAEDFAYSMQAQGRATIIGEQTGGGAHAVDFYIIQHSILLNLPVSRAINPVTGGNWEGSGVQPDIEVPAADALNVAHLMALENLVEFPIGDFRIDAFRQRAYENLYASLNPAPVSAEQLTSLTGNYGLYQFSVQHEQLFVGASLAPISETLFADTLSLNQYEFDQQPDGTIAGMWVILPTGERLYNPRLD